MIIVAVAFVFSLGLTAMVRHYTTKHGLLDLPNGRSSHTVPTPRGGGLSIVLVFLGMSLWLHNSGKLSLDFLTVLVGGGVSIALVGFLDDRGHLPAPVRLLVHVAAAVWAVVWLASLPSFAVGSKIYILPPWGAAIVVLFLVWCINLYNFMDGIDGIAGIEAVSVALGAAAILFFSGERDVIPSLLILAGASLGFLCWNWSPAKIFMGDVGSGFLGFVLGVFVLYIPTHSRMNFWSWLILLGAFWADATVTLLVRAIKGERLHLAHRSHAYQHLARRFQSHQKVTLGFLGINVFWLFPLAFFATVNPAWGVWLTGLAMTPLIVFCIWAGAGRA